MRRFVYYILSFGIMMLILSSCSSNLRPFTDQLYEKTYWGEEDLKKIQFYLSDDIVLYRELRGKRADIKEGEIIIEDGSKVQKIVIPAETPGVFVFTPDNKRFAISFEQGSDNYLMFGPNPKLDGRYTLLASEWKRNRGMVTYGGRKFWADRRSALSALLVDLKRFGKYEQEKKVIRGRRVD
jgi:hypothetical protein